MLEIYGDGSAINNENPNVPTLGGVGVATPTDEHVRKEKVELKAAKPPVDGNPTNGSDPSAEEWLNHCFQSGISQVPPAASILLRAEAVKAAA